MSQSNLKIRVRLSGDEPPQQDLTEAPYEMRAPERMVISSTPRSPGRYLVTSLVAIALIAAVSAFAIYRILGSNPETGQQAATGTETTASSEINPLSSEESTTKTALEIPPLPVREISEPAPADIRDEEAGTGREVVSTLPETESARAPEPADDAPPPSAGIATAPETAAPIEVNPNETDAADAGMAGETVPLTDAEAIETASITPVVPAAAETTADATESEYIARAVLTSGIRNREPVDTIGPNISSKESTARQVYLFTEFRDLQGHKVVHRWEYEGEPVVTVNFRVGGDRWRVYSSKLLPPHMTGEWRVSVEDTDGSPLGTYTFLYE
ncbi:MAG: DUF2914 domain-containing protein [Pseudomonadota bacterium]|nr:DUF2914 domain-containing protein [Pseudomonadota bacterium]